jgi:hypothetical protein
MDLLSKNGMDVLICYLSSKGISKLKSIEVHNAILVDWDSEQQNITHFTILGTKQSFFIYRIRYRTNVKILIKEPMLV